MNFRLAAAFPQQDQCILSCFVAKYLYMVYWLLSVDFDVMHLHMVGEFVVKFVFSRCPTLDPTIIFASQLCNS